jgi:hypothetical protein
MTEVAEVNNINANVNDFILRVRLINMKASGWRIDVTGGVVSVEQGVTSPFSGV